MIEEIMYKLPLKRYDRKVYLRGIYNGKTNPEVLIIY